MSEWREATLGELVDMSSGGTPRMTNKDYWGGDIPWISASSLKSLRLSQSDRMVTSGAIGNGTKIAPAGSILIVVRGMSLRKEIRVGKAIRDVAFNQDVKALRVHGDAIPDFLLYTLHGREDDLLGMVRAATNGTGVLPTELLIGLNIALPPIDEQRRIVAVMTALDAHLEALEAEATQIEAMLIEAREHIVQSHVDEFGWVEIGQVVHEVKRPIAVDDSSLYDQIGIRSHGRGIFTKESVSGESLGNKKVFWVEPGDLVINIVFGWEAAVAVVPISHLRTR
jgi:type I restriction enzyme S subunit